ncbi:MAG TPA: CRTAC1 family protein, partial [Bryobacteraceae bacterium]|nr:CRTAC1 family protein [Bryobacteraceae bacterium]
VLDNIALFSPRAYEEPNAVFRNLAGGKFADVSAQAGADFQVAAAHRGLAYGDLDNDGRLDAVVSVLNGKAEVFHNITQNGNHWLMLQLIGTKSNRMAIGARLKLTTTTGQVQYNHVSTSTGYACSSDPRVHFGLGAATGVKEVQIRWPSGRVQVLHDVGVDRILKITEPD